MLHPSDTHPFRRFSWTDHRVDPGDEVSYRVVPVRAKAAKLDEASEWSEERTIGAPNGSCTPFFNRGFVISQFMSRYLAEHFKGMAMKDALQAFKQDLGDHEDAIRAFLSGQLREALLGFVRGLAPDEQVHAALYELKDAELEGALCALGARAHVLLANGSIAATSRSPPAGRTTRTSSWCAATARSPRRTRSTSRAPGATTPRGSARRTRTSPAWPTWRRCSTTSAASARSGDSPEPVTAVSRAG
jgi:hypothetical protein